MPIQVDHARPVRTVDTHGSIISTDTNTSAPMKAVDSVGRQLQEDASRVASEAAAANPDIPKELPKSATDAAPEGTPTEKDVRRTYLEAQKVLRKAQQREKMASAKLADAEGYEKARQQVESGENPFALVEFAKIDKVKNYREATTYALNDKKTVIEDPVQKELREHKERLDKYAKDLEVQAKTIQEKEDLAAHNKVIADKVIPLLQADPDKYECLVTEYGPNAAVEVYKTVWDIYQQTGKARSFTEVADEMEEYWRETIDKGIQSARKLKKFQNQFSQTGEEHRQSASDRSETPRRSVTLSNKPSAPAPITAFAPRKRVLTRDERVAEILKRFPD